MAPDDFSVLILEDQFLLAMDLASKVEQIGCSVIGPYRNVQAAMQALEEIVPKAALLDINLGQGSTSEPVAEKLQTLGVPFAFITGYSSDIPIVQRFGGVPYSSKPIDVSKVQSLLATLMPIDKAS
ncbi:MAG: hypothetical protein AAGA08_07125 [Pseudomonadota bacterium]